MHLVLYFAGCFSIWDIFMWLIFPESFFYTGKSWFHFRIGMMEGPLCEVEVIFGVFNGGAIKFNDAQLVDYVLNHLTQPTSRMDSL
jgi:hypothetical protein